MTKIKRTCNGCGIEKELISGKYTKPQSEYFCKACSGKKKDIPAIMPLNVPVLPKPTPLKCPDCGKNEIWKCGTRPTRTGKKAIFQCKDCAKKFTVGHDGS